MPKFLQNSKTSYFLAYPKYASLLHYCFCCVFACFVNLFSYICGHKKTKKKLYMRRSRALVCPRSIELKDLNGDLHNLEVKVLGTEETWNTPSLLLANSLKCGGRAVFSQVFEYI